MNIALLSSTIDAKDGYGNITWELTHALHAAGVSFTLFLPEDQKKILQERPVPFVTECVLPPYIYRIFSRAGWRYFLPRKLHGFDLVHSIFEFPYAILASCWACSNRLPLIVGGQGTHAVRPLTYFPEKYLVKRMYAQAKRLVFPSAYTKNLVEQYAGRSYPIDIIHNGVNFDRFQRQTDSNAVRAQFPGKNILLTVGGLWGRKGHDIVLRALPAVLKEFPQTVYVMVGEGNAREQLSALADSLGILQHVHFAGRKSGDDLVAYFQACDMYVHTPTAKHLKFEGFGIVYLEASACGKPIVATDAGGIRDAVLDGQTGLVANQDDVAGVAEHICTLLRDAPMRSAMGNAGREYARQHAWGNIAQQFLQIYESVLKIE